MLVEGRGGILQERPLPEEMIDELRAENVEFIVGNDPEQEIPRMDTEFQYGDDGVDAIHVESVMIGEICEADFQKYKNKFRSDIHLGFKSIFASIK